MERRAKKDALKKFLVVLLGPARFCRSGPEGSASAGLSVSSAEPMLLP